jgi:hypothetical protein
MKDWGKMTDNAAVEEFGGRGAEVCHGVSKVPQTKGNLRILFMNGGEISASKASSLHSSSTPR